MATTDSPISRSGSRIQHRRHEILCIDFDESKVEQKISSDDATWRQTAGRKSYDHAFDAGDKMIIGQNVARLRR